MIDPSLVSTAWIVGGVAAGLAARYGIAVLDRKHDERQQHEADEPEQAPKTSPPADPLPAAVASPVRIRPHIPAIAAGRR